MPDPTFTILLPVIRPPTLLPLAVESVQQQTRGDFELLVVCDGAPEETVTAARALAAEDDRIRVFPFPKGERHGEAHRHTALQDARGTFVCQISDDDLWFPDHLEQMDALLQRVEFGNLLHAFLWDAGNEGVFLADLEDALVQSRMLEHRWNFFGPTAAGYRMETYRRLPIGWSPAPDGIWTDLFMWRKFLSLDGISAGSRFVVTSIHFPTPPRKDWGLEARERELSEYAQLLRDPSWRRDFAQQVLRRPARTLATLWDTLERAADGDEALQQARDVAWKV